jgi:hypothetical protein
MKKLLSLFLSSAFFISVAAQGTIPQSTKIVATDINGKTWDIDAILNSGKVLAIEQTFSG